jgi:hypothetical protein
VQYCKILENGQFDSNKNFLFLGAPTLLFLLIVLKQGQNRP